MIKVVVKPSSKEESILEKGGVFYVSVKEPADKDKANKAVLKLLSRHFKKRAFLKSGRTSKEKLIEFK